MTLSIIVFIPLIGALLCLVVPKKQVRVVAVATTLMMIISASNRISSTFTD